MTDLLEYPRFYATLRLGVCCRKTFLEVIRDDALWARRCAKLWHNKVSVPVALRANPDIRSFFWSRRAATDVSPAHLAHIITSTCFHMRFAQGTAQLYGFEDHTGRAVPMFRKFAPGGRYLRYPEPHDIVSNPCALHPVKDPVERHEELYGPLLPGHSLKWALSPEGDCIALANLPPLRVSRRADNWAWRLENEFLVYETCSPETINDPSRLEISVAGFPRQASSAPVTPS